MRSYEKSARADAEGRTRAALLDAATTAFFAGRWEATSLNALADDAGVTKQTLLRHFGSKDGLLQAAFDVRSDEVGAQRLDTPAGDVARAVDNLLDHYDALGDRALRLEAIPPGATGADYAQTGRELHYAWVDHVFGPLLAARRGRDRKRRRAALIALCDVHTWRLLTRQLGMSRADVRATLLLSIRGVLEEETT